MKFHFQATIERRVRDTITLVVDTEYGLDDALVQARNALNVYPKAVAEDGVSSIYTEDRKNLTTEIVHIERMVPTHDNN